MSKQIIINRLEGRLESDLIPSSTIIRITPNTAGSAWPDVIEAGQHFFLTLFDAISQEYEIVKVVGTSNDQYATLKTYHVDRRHEVSPGLVIADWPTSTRVSQLINAQMLGDFDTRIQAIEPAVLTPTIIAPADNSTSVNPNVTVQLSPFEYGNKYDTPASTEILVYATPTPVGEPFYMYTGEYTTNHYVTKQLPISTECCVIARHVGVVHGGGNYASSTFTTVDPSIIQPRILNLKNDDIGIPISFNIQVAPFKSVPEGYAIPKAENNFNHRITKVSDGTVNVNTFVTLPAEGGTIPVMGLEKLTKYSYECAWLGEHDNSSLTSIIFTTGDSYIAAPAISYPTEGAIDVAPTFSMPVGTFVCEPEDFDTPHATENFNVTISTAAGVIQTNKYLIPTDGTAEVAITGLPLLTPVTLECWWSGTNNEGARTKRKFTTSNAYVRKPTMVTPIANSTVYTVINTQSDAFASFGIVDTHKSTNWYITSDAAGLVIVAEALNSTDLVTHSFTDISYAVDTVLYAWCEHVGTTLGKSARSNSTKFTIKQNIIAPSGRRFSRHPNGKGTIIEYTMFGVPQKLFVADAVYRFSKSTYASSTKATLSPEKREANTNNNFYINGIKAISSSDTDMHLNTDKYLSSIWYKGIAGCSSRGTTIACINSGASTTWRAQLYNVSIPDINVLCVPSSYQLMILYLEQDTLDSLDPTVAANPKKALNAFASGAWDNSKILAGNATSYGYIYLDKAGLFGGSSHDYVDVGPLFFAPVSELRPCTELVTSGGRKLYRHPNDNGTIMEYVDAYNLTKKVFIADSNYRISNECRYTVGSTLYRALPKNTRGDAYIHPQSASPNYHARIPVSDSVLNTLFSNQLKDEVSSTEMCDTYIAAIPYGLNIIEYARSVAVNGRACNLPNLNILIRLFLDASFIDVMDASLYRTSTFDNDFNYTMHSFACALGRSNLRKYFYPLRNSDPAIGAVAPAVPCVFLDPGSTGIGVHLLPINPLVGTLDFQVGGIGKVCGMVLIQDIED